MVAYSFKAQFAQPILDGTKGGTIRADRKRHARPGEELQLYTAMRTRQCRLIARKECLAVAPLVLDFLRSTIVVGHLSIYDRKRLDEFARFDGFPDFGSMRRFWNGDARFDGWHIRWLPLPANLERAA